MAKQKKAYLVVRTEQVKVDEVSFSRELIVGVYSDFGRAVGRAAHEAGKGGDPVPLKKSWTNRRKADEIERVTTQRAFNDDEPAAIGDVISIDVRVME